VPFKGQGKENGIVRKKKKKKKKKKTTRTKQKEESPAAGSPSPGKLKRVPGKGKSARRALRRGKKKLAKDLGLIFR